MRLALIFFSNQILILACYYVKQEKLLPNVIYKYNNYFSFPNKIFFLVQGVGAILSHFFAVRPSILNTIKPVVTVLIRISLPQINKKKNA